MVHPRVLCLATTCGTLAMRPGSSYLAPRVRFGFQTSHLSSPSSPLPRYAGYRSLSILSGSNEHDDAEFKNTKDAGEEGTHKLNSFSGKVVPLGTAFTVRRLLPFRKQRSVGPFVFLDHFGPVQISEHAMNVGPHPHIGLMTLTYLFEGAILHRDSTGAEEIIVPGEVNGMIAGKGVTHSERGQLEDIKAYLESRNLEAPTGSHGLQLWMALSKDGEDVDPSFHHGPAVPIDSKATLVVGESNGFQQSSIPIDPRLGKVVYVDIHFQRPKETFEICSPGGTKGIDDMNAVDDSIELGLYVSSGKVGFAAGWEDVDGETLEAGNMVVVKAPDATTFQASIRALSHDTRVAILGGTPLPEKRHMFWNFVSATKEKVDKAANAWEHLDRNVFPEVANEANDDSISLPTQQRLINKK